MENLPLRGFEATCCACVSFTWEIVRDSLIINVVSLTTDTGALPRMFADDTNQTGRHCIVPSALESAILSLFDENGCEVAK